MSRKRPLKQYRGELTPDQIAIGINAARENARRLLADAKVLFEKGSIATACSLAILAIEEAGKTPCLRRIASAKSEEQLKNAWRDYRDHRSKNVAWIFLDLVRNGARTLDDMKPIFDRESDHPDVLNAIKQLGFYTDCYEKARWAEPQTAIEIELAQSIIRVADVLASKTTVTAREIELWVEHVGPDVEMGTDRKRLANFYRAMKDEGLLNRNEELLKRFLNQ